jgi:hypothetical protein
LRPLALMLLLEHLSFLLASLFYRWRQFFLLAGLFYRWRLFFSLA